MANSVPWLETSPANTDDVLEGALRIRETKEAIRERMNRDHMVGGTGEPSAGTLAGMAANEDTGFHRRVTLKELNLDYTPTTGLGILNAGGSPPPLGSNITFGELWLGVTGKDSSGAANKTTELHFQGSAAADFGNSRHTVVTLDHTQTLVSKTLDNPIISNHANLEIADSGTGKLDNMDIGSRERCTKVITTRLAVGPSKSIPGTDGNCDIEGNLGVDGNITTLSHITALGNLTINGNTQLGSDQATDELTIYGVLAAASITGNGLVLNEDDMDSDSTAHLATQASIKQYVDDRDALNDLDLKGDSGDANMAINAASQVLKIAGGTGIDTSGSNTADGGVKTLTVAIDSTVYRSGGTDVAVADGGTGAGGGAASCLNIGAVNSVSGYGTQSNFNTANTSYIASNIISINHTSNNTGSPSDYLWFQNSLGTNPGGNDPSTGEAWVTNFGIYPSFSDERLKTNIEDYTESSLTKIALMKVRKFNWKKDLTRDTFGIIAQELEDILPQAVGYVPQNDGRDLRNLDIQYLVFTLIKAVQELDDRTKS